MTPRWWSQRRWQIALLLLLVTAVGSIDRQAMSVTAGTIKAAYGLTNTQYGALGFAFLLSYAVGQFFSGMLVDRFGTRRALSFAVVAWSFAAMAHALAQGFWGFFIARACLGLTEGPNLPAAVKAIAEWFPRAERSMATGMISAGTGLGLILAPPVAGLLTAAFSWHAAFLVPGIAGLVWVWFWHRRYFLPEEHPDISAAERELAMSDRIVGTPRGGSLRERLAIWAHYLRYRATWGLVLARFVGDGAFYFFTFWLPLYLQTQRGFSMLSVAFVAVLPFVFADLGSLSGGWAGQSLIRRGWSVDRSRKTMIWIGAIGALVAWPVALVDSWIAALALASVAIMSIQVKTASLFPLAADIFPARDVATVWGMSGAAGSLGGALFQWGVGLMVDHYGYDVVFALASTMCVAQALLISLFIRRVEPLAEAVPFRVGRAVERASAVRGPCSRCWPCRRLRRVRWAVAGPMLVQDCPTCPNSWSSSPWVASSWGRTMARRTVPKGRCMPCDCAGPLRSGRLKSRSPTSAASLPPQAMPWRPDAGCRSANRVQGAASSGATIPRAAGRIRASSDLCARTSRSCVSAGSMRWPMSNGSAR